MKRDNKIEELFYPTKIISAEDLSYAVRAMCYLQWARGKDRCIVNCTECAYDEGNLVEFSIILCKEYGLDKALAFQINLDDKINKPLLDAEDAIKCSVKKGILRRDYEKFLCP